MWGEAPVSARESETETQTANPNGHRGAWGRKSFLIVTQQIEIPNKIFTVPLLFTANQSALLDRCQPEKWLSVLTDRVLGCLEARVRSASGEDGAISVECDGAPWPARPAQQPREDRSR